MILSDLFYDFQEILKPCCSINYFRSQNMSQEKSIQKKAVFIQQVKNEMAQRIAELNELFHLKSQLQSRCTLLKDKLQQLKNQLYKKQQNNVSLGLEKIQLKRQLQNQTEIQHLINSSKLNVLSEISSQRQSRQKFQNVISSAKEKQKALKVQLKQLEQAKNNMMNQVKQFDKKIQFLSISSQKRNQISVKLRQSVKYFTQKSLLIKDKCQKCKQILEKIQVQSISIQQSIEKSSLKASSNINIVQDNVRQIEREQQAIQSEKLKRKVLQEKYKSIKERLGELQQQQKYCRIIIDKKKTQVERKEHNQNLKLSKWKEIRAKVQLQIQYSQYFCQSIVL